MTCVHYTYSVRYTKASPSTRGGPSGRKVYRSTSRVRNLLIIQFAAYPTSVTMNPNTTNNVLGHLLLRFRSDNAAFSTENLQLRNQLAHEQARMHQMINWNRELLQASLNDSDTRRRMREGCRIVMDRMDDMYDLYMRMVEHSPAIGIFAEDVQRIVLQAEVGRALMVQEVIDLTGEDTEEELDEDEVEL